MTLEGRREQNVQTFGPSTMESDILIIKMYPTNLIIVAKTNRHKPHNRFNRH